MCTAADCGNRRESGVKLIPPVFINKIKNTPGKENFGNQSCFPIFERAAAGHQ